MPQRRADRAGSLSYAACAALCCAPRKLRFTCCARAHSTVAHQIFYTELTQVVQVLKCMDIHHKITLYYLTNQRIASVLPDLYVQKLAWSYCQSTVYLNDRKTNSIGSRKGSARVEQRGFVFDFIHIHKRNQHHTQIKMADSSKITNLQGFRKTLGAI